MADITTVYYLNTSKTSESRLYAYFYNSAERNFIEVILMTLEWVSWLTLAIKVTIILVILK